MKNIIETVITSTDDESPKIIITQQESSHMSNNFGPQIPYQHSYGGFSK